MSTGNILITRLFVFNHPQLRWDEVPCPFSGFRNKLPRLAVELAVRITLRRVIADSLCVARQR
jgi:hypothetical protein